MRNSSAQEQDPNQSSSPNSPQVSRLGRYEIMGKIAAGGTATVYLAKLCAAGGFHREFALKVVHPHLLDMPGFRERVLEEARLASRIRHPNAVRTVDVGESHGYTYLVLELIDGVNLRQLMLHRSRPFSPRQAAVIVGAVARGLHALHTATGEAGQALGMVHRDISPHNVMLDRTGRALLIDLGLAKAVDRTDRQDLTQEGVLCGKLPYMSPEQARSETVDARSDVFALGTVLFELCTGHLPFGETHSAKTLTALENCDLKRLDRRLGAAMVPRWLIGVVLTCLRREPDQRFGSAAEVADALTQELATQAIDETRVLSTLTSIVEASMADLGQVEPATPLVPLITAAHTSKRRLPSALRYVALGAIAAGIAVITVLSSGSTRQYPERTYRRAVGSLAADKATERKARPATEVHRREAPSERRAPKRASPLLAPTVPPPPPLLEPLRPAPRRRSSGPAPAELKPNPYATQ